MKLFYFFLLFVSRSFFFQIRDIPVSVSPDHQTVDLMDFDSKYPSFARVGEMVRNRILSDLSLFIDKKYPTNGFCIIARIKLPLSLKRKMDFDLRTKNFRDFFYKDFEDVKDFVRSSLIFLSKDDIYAAARLLEGQYGEYLKKDDSFDLGASPNGKGGTGYRDMTLNFAIKDDKFGLKINRTISPANEPDPYYLRFEIQLHLCGIFLVKNIGHLIYEMIRVLRLVTPVNVFEKIVPQIQEREFLEIFDKIVEALPEGEEKQNLIKNFQAWKSNKNNLKTIDEFLKALNNLSKRIYDKAFVADQAKCKEKMKKIMNNERCEIISEQDFEETSLSFVKEIL